jgi:nucleoid-associated protein YgaU
MHPDRKIGIAMGILLVGVVGALFFRNEPLDQQMTSGMRREQELNERLRDRDVAVYFEDGQTAGSEVDEVERQLQQLLESDLYPDDPVPEPTGIEQTSAQPTASGPPPISHDGVLIDPSGRMRPALPETGGVASATTDRSNRPADSSTNVAASPPEATQSAHGPDADDFSATPPEFDEYTVQFGDTLSEIAERFLGSQTRYRDIYEANRDRMASPDQLKVGKAIRIPRVYR